MGFFPLLMNLTGRTCLVVGGGSVASRKVADLTECGAEVIVVAEQMAPALVDQPAVTIHQRSFEDADVKGMALVIAATDHEQTNRQVYDAAHCLSIPVNVVDVPDLCDFIVASTIRRGDLVVAISTCGAAPSLSRKIREELEERFPDYYEPYIATLARLREQVKAQVSDEARRRAIFERLSEPDILEAIRIGGMAMANTMMETIVTEGINGS